MNIGINPGALAVGLLVVVVFVLAWRLRGKSDENKALKGQQEIREKSERIVAANRELEEDELDRKLRGE